MDNHEASPEAGRTGHGLWSEDLLHDFKAAFGRGRRGRLASLAVLAGQHQDEAKERSAHECDELQPELGAWSHAGSAPAITGALLRGRPPVGRPWPASLTRAT
jgi:hypothetical protein